MSNKSRVEESKSIDEYIFDIEDYVGGNIEGVEPVDRMAFTVFLRRTLAELSDQEREKARREVTDFQSLRKSLKITQQDIAAFLGVSRLTYIGYEKDPMIMPLGRYLELTAELNRLKAIKTGNREGA